MAQYRIGIDVYGKPRAWVLEMIHDLFSTVRPDREALTASSVALCLDPGGLADMEKAPENTPRDLILNLDNWELVQYARKFASRPAWISRRDPRRYLGPLPAEHRGACFRNGEPELLYVHRRVLEVYRIPEPVYSMSERRLPLVATVCAARMRGVPHASIQAWLTLQEKRPLPLLEAESGGCRRERALLPDGRANEDIPAAGQVHDPRERRSPALSPITDRLFHDEHWLRKSHRRTRPART